MSVDYLKALSDEDLAAWYRRLADMWTKGRPDLGFPQTLEEPLAGKFLLTWLDNRVAYKKYPFDAPPHLRSLELKQVRAVLLFHRKVFLSMEKKKDGNYGGIVPRVQSGKWDMRGDLALDYESLCEVGDGYFDITRIQEKGTPAEKDILYAMHGFQLKSACKVFASREGNSSKVEIRFREWFASIEDKYHWKTSVGLTVPNPDFKSTDTKAVRPKDDRLLVHHTNARRLENAGLAAPFTAIIRPWYVNDSEITKGATIDTKK